MELFWSAFSRIRTEYGEIRILRIIPYSVRMWENAGQNKSEYGHFLRSVTVNNLSPKFIQDKVKQTFLWFILTKDDQ